jgi:hypothetical protein
VTDKLFHKHFNLNVSGAAAYDEEVAKPIDRGGRIHKH